MDYNKTAAGISTNSGLVQNSTSREYKDNNSYRSFHAFCRRNHLNQQMAIAYLAIRYQHSLEDLPDDVIIQLWEALKRSLIVGIEDHLILPELSCLARVVWMKDLKPQIDREEWL